MSWTVMMAAGFGFMIGMKWTPPLIDFILIRLAAGAFAGAGTIGATGWIGDWLDKILNFVVWLVNKLSGDALGTPAAWIIVAGASIMWVGALLPGKLFKLDFPDWLVVSGAFLPSLIGAVPGKGGDFLDTAMTTAGTWTTNWVGGIF